MYNNTRSFRTHREVQRSKTERIIKDHRMDLSRYVKKAVGMQRAEYVATHAFADFQITTQLKKNIAEKGYVTPTPIQDKAIPVIINGQDVIGIANTGTGKTAAFLIPLISKISQDRSQRILVIAPTRELAVQIEEEYKAFAKGMGLFSALLIGGMSMKKQEYSLRRHPHIIIATPGRLKDLEVQGKVNLWEYNNIVLDEVDRMLDMGFIRDIKHIITKLPKKRQSLFFSATVPNGIRDIMQQLLHNPITISVHQQQASENVHQDVIHTYGKPKIDVLESLLKKDEFQKVLVFGRTKWGIEKLTRELERRGFKVAAIHGNKKQTQRLRALEAFKNNQVQVLLATDIASRGIDVESVTHVINYEIPESYDDYIHRIGRTGRADKVGNALTFVD